MVDARTPVIVGGGQWSNRVDQGARPVEPVDLMAEALRRAATDSGSPRASALLTAADAVWTVRMLSWRYANPSALVAQRLGASPGDTAVSPVGGNEPQSLVNQACAAVASGDAEVVLIGGAEAWRSRRDPGGAALGWTAEDAPELVGVGPARATGDEAPLNHPAEIARGIYLPTQIYPLFEQARRHAAGRTVADHMVRVSELWARFSEVAATNEHAWLRDPMSAADIRTPSAGNRYVGWPYTKVMNANNAVEQGAGLIVMAAGRARDLGVPRDRWIFPLASTEAHDHYAVSHRADLASSPAIRAAGRRLFELAGTTVDEVAHVDLYSCFPSAVQVAADELGLQGDRDLTVTGGLAFAGGPWNDYVTHSLAAMVARLRDHPGELGLVTANGGYLTKHALGLYGTEPPEGGFRWASVQDEVDALPCREVVGAGGEGDGREGDGGAAGESGGATGHEGHIESWVVMHDRDARPEQAVAAVLLDDGRRAWATSTETATLAELVSGAEQIGRKVEVGPGGALTI